MDAILDETLFTAEPRGVIRLAPFTVLPARAQRSKVARHTPSGEMQDYDVREFEVLHDDGWVMRLGLYRFDNDEACIEARDATPAPPRLIRLERGLCLKVTRVPDAPELRMVCLRQAHVLARTEDAWSSLHTADHGMLDGGARQDVFALLRRFNASEIARKSELLGEGGPGRDPYAALFEPDNWRLPVAAYLLTRVLPIYYQHPRVAA